MKAKLTIEVEIKVEDLMEKKVVESLLDGVIGTVKKAPIIVEHEHEKDSEILKNE